MSIIAYEVVGRTGDATQRSLKYHVRDPAKGPVTDADAVTAVLAESPTSHFGFERRSINLSEVGLNYYEVVVQYGEHTVTPAKATPPDGELQYSFETTVESVDVKRSLATVSSQISATYSTAVAAANAICTLQGLPTISTSAPDLKGAINVTADGVQGTQIFIPTTRFQYRMRASAADFYGALGSFDAYQLRVEELVGTVNDAPFHGRPAGSVLFDGLTGGWQTTLDDGSLGWDLSFAFRFRKNRTGITIGDIPPFDAKGWEYVHPLFAPAKQTGTHLLLVEPLAVYVEQMYEDGDLSILGI